MKKTFDTTSILNELRGQSVFFPPKKEPERQEAPTLPDTSESQPENHPLDTLSRMQDSLQSSKLTSKHASTLAGPEDMIELIRKIVKNPAKEEVLYVRLTKEEKTRLGEITYTYIRQGRKTTDNELGRIALNFLVADYQANGAQSILAKVIEALNA